jgi:hypothetical protein
MHVVAGNYGHQSDPGNYQMSSFMSIKKPTRFIAGVFLTGMLFLISTEAVFAESEAIDASDPTKIYTYMGGGLKYNEYTNGEYMLEARITGNLGLSTQDALLFEAGYGWHKGDQAPGDDSGFTNVRLRWFHLFDMNYELEQGYRGWGTQVDVQLAGELKGTDGQNQVVLGVMPTYALGGNWNLYLQLNLVNAWDKKFKYWNGAGSNLSPQFVFSPDNWWPGAQVQIIPQYTYFVTGDLEDEGSGVFELNVGGEITPTVMWDITYQRNFDIDLKSLIRKESEKLENDWNVFFNVTSYF